MRFPWIIEQTTFTQRQVLELSGKLADARHDFHDLYMRLNLPFGSETNVASVLGIMILADCSAAGLPLHVVITHVSKLILHGLVTLGCEEKSINVSGTSSEITAFQDWLHAAGTVGKQHRLAELLNIQGRSTSRFLVGGESNNMFTSNDISEAYIGAENRYSIVIDAGASARSLQQKHNTSLFNVFSVP